MIHAAPTKTKVANPSKDPLSAQTRDSRFALLLFAVFLAVGCLVIFRHEVWRDEFQAWMITWDSTSLSNLFYNLRYDGHPPVWYLILYPASRFTSHPLAMQITHLLLAAGAVYIFARYAPFSRLARVLFSFGYFPFYEYMAISRNYAVGVLLLFAFCALFRHRKTTLLPITVVLVLLAGASAYGWMLTAALSMTLCAAWYADRRSGERWSVPRWEIALSLLVFICTMGISTVVMMPESDSGQYVEWFIGFDLGKVVSSLGAFGSAHTLAPSIFTQWQMEVDRATFPLAQAIIGAAFLVYCLLLFSRRPVVFFAYLSATAIMLALIYSKHGGVLRHHGHFYLMSIACMWLATYYNDWKMPWKGMEKLSRACVRYNSTIMLVLLSIQFAGGIAAAGRDVIHPFSQAKNVAQYIEANGMADMPIIGERDAPTSSVAGYLGRGIYYPANGARVGTFIVFDNTRQRTVTDEELLEAIRTLISEEQRDVLLVMNRELSAEMIRQSEAQLLEVFSEAIVTDETYWLYRVEQK